MKTTKRIAVAACLAALAMPMAALAQGQGPVATACQEDIPKLCAGLEHGQGAVRKCLEANKEKVSPGCKTALESTGPGQGMGAGQGPGSPR